MSYTVFVGIDVSKDSFAACTINKDRKILFESNFTMDRDGFEGLTEMLSSFPRESILIGGESSGCYHINLFSFLSEKGFSCVILNPLLISNFMKMSLRNTKTDRKDARSISLFLSMFHESIPEKNILSSELKDLAREREHIAQEIARIKNDIEKLISILFPELQRKVNIYNRSILKFISSFPSARSVKMAPRKKIRETLEYYGRGRKVDISEEEIIKLARASIASFHPAKELILTQKASLLMFLMDRAEEIEEMLKKIYKDSEFNRDIDILTSIKGIGDITAMHFLSEIGDIKRFESCRKLIAYAGLDPTVYQSGKYQGKSKLSKRGNRHIRRVIWLMTSMAIRFNEVFREYFVKRRNEGLPYKKAVIATAHKLIRVIFSMLSHKRYFSYESPSRIAYKELNS